MKRLLLALILAVVLTVTFAAPAFAGDSPDAAKKGLERTIELYGGNDHTYESLRQGLLAPWYYGQNPNGWAGPIVAYYLILDFLGN
ncbi:MAG: hypothetical protein ACETVS_01890 [Dehalococcoidales bacterium]